MGTDIWRRPITDESAWTPADLATDRGWEYELSADQVEACHRLADQLAASGAALAEIRAADVAPSELDPLLRDIGRQVRHGRGMAVLHGVPVADHSLADVERLYWAMMTRLGTGLTQNSDASLIHYVTDGVLRPNQGGRGVGKPDPAPLHVDLTDCVSLLCIRQAVDDPPSWLASSTTVHNVIAERDPEALEVLYRGFVWDRLDEQGPGEDPSSPYLVPVFSHVGGVVSCRYNRYWMSAANRRTGGRHSDEARAALDLFDEVAHANRLELHFEPGDVQFVNNYVVLHGRAGHDAQPDESLKRLLMRIWVDFDEPRPVADDAVVRYGIVRHGRLGWTADQLASGLVDSGHPRAADGRPLVAH